MGGGGGLIGGLTGAIFGEPDKPATPDYTGAAQATASGNLDAARAASAANRVNQYTPYGSLEYSQSGQDQYGNPTWSARTNLSDVGQQLLNTQNQTSLGLGGAINAQLGQVNNVMGQGFNPNAGSITTSAGQANLDPRYQRNTDYAGGMAGWDKANQILQARLAPQMAQQQEAQAATLANQGIVQGTKAYENAMRTFNQGQNDLLTNSQLAGQNIGQNLFTQGLQGAQFGNQALTQQNAAQQQEFANRMANANLGNQAQQQKYTQALTNYQIPLNTLSALRTGAQVQNPTFQNVPQQATTAGADYLGAAGLTGQANQAAANATNAQNNAMMGGLFSLGGASLMAPAGTFSDIRTKENIVKIGTAKNGLPFYLYEYKPEWKDKAGYGQFIGYMAHEVEEYMPQAVITCEDGIKKVRYDLL
jgi:hypothetical protein